jgi:hypothetical protein
LTIPFHAAYRGNYYLLSIVSLATVLNINFSNKKIKIALMGTTPKEFLPEKLIHGDILTVIL